MDEKHWRWDQLHRNSEDNQSQECWVLLTVLKLNVLSALGGPLCQSYNYLC